MAYNGSLLVFLAVMLGLSWFDPPARAWMIRQWSRLGVAQGSGDTSLVKGGVDTSDTGDTIPAVPASVEERAWGYVDASSSTVVELEPAKTATSASGDEVKEWIRKKAGTMPHATLKAEATRVFPISESTFDRRYREVVKVKVKG